MASGPNITSQSHPLYTTQKDNDAASKKLGSVLQEEKSATDKTAGFKKSTITSLLLNNDSSIYKELIIKELRITRNSDEYNQLMNGNDDSFNSLVKIKILNKSHELEQLRSQNLDKLNLLLDKCQESDKLDNIVLNNIFNYINTDTKTNLENRSPSPIHSSASNFSLNTTKKRKLDLPPNRSPKLASPRGHRRYKSEIPSINEISLSSYPSNKNAPGSMPYPLQPYQLPASVSIPSNNPSSMTNLGGQGNLPYSYQYNSVYGTEAQRQMPQQVQQEVLNRPNFPTQGGFPPQPTTVTQGYPTQGYGIPPQNRQVFMISPINNENLNPSNTNNNRNNDNPYFNIPQQYPNLYPQQSLVPPAPQASPCRPRQSSTSKPIKKGHRRSQSASVSLGLHNNNNNNIDFKSPQIFNNQKPVNFLIHTPKHPPPS